MHKLINTTVVYVTKHNLLIHYLQSLTTLVQLNIRHIDNN